MSYQWYFNGTAIGANTPVYTISSVQPQHFGTYRVVITDVNGQSVTSTEATLSSGARIVMPTGANEAVPYPATVTLSGFLGPASKVTVTIKGFKHYFPDNLDIGVVGPTGRAVWLMTWAGGSTAGEPMTFQFDDTVGTPIPDNGPLVSGGIYHTANYAGYPLPPAGTLYPDLSAFNGINPNGIWSLYVYNEGGVPGEICDFTVNVFP